MSVVLNTRDKDNSSVLILTMNRPEAMNSFNSDICMALIKAIKAADKDPSVRVIILTGAGKAFCAGADISEGFASVETEIIDEATGIKRDWGGVLNLVTFECDTPIIAAVNGAAVGIGATMLVPMDMRIASTTSKFGFPFARRGIVFDGAASWFLPRLVGFARAQEWLLAGRIIMAEEMLAAGFVTELQAPENVLPRALEIARDIAVNCSPTSIANNKRLFRASILGHGTIETGPYPSHILESDMLNKAFISQDCKEGVTAFFEKRAPNFEDRQN